MPSPRRPLSLRALVLAACAAVVLPVLTAPSTAGAEEPPAGGETVVGELVRAWPEHENPAEARAHAHEGPLTWIETAPGEAVRVPTEAVEDIAVGATVEVTVGDPVVDTAAEEDGLQAAREVLAAEVLAEPSSEPTTAPATQPYTNTVTVVLVQVPGSAPDGMTPEAVATAVDGPVSAFWEEQSGGTIRLGVVATHPWVSSSVGCSDPSGLFADVATKVGFQAGAGKHLLLYLPGISQDLPGCSYGLAQVRTGPGDGGALYVRATRTSLLAHEFGHNFGLGHSSRLQCDGLVDAGACQVTSYDDWYDVMGVSWQQLGSLNSPHAHRLGLLPEGAAVEVGAGGPETQVTLSPLGARTGTRTVRFTDSRGLVHWLEYRTATGRDEWLATTANWRGLQPGLLLRVAGSGHDASLLLDGTPSAPSAWSSDVGVAIPVGTPARVGNGEFVVTLEAAGADGATVRVQPLPQGLELVAHQQLAPGRALVSPDGRHRAVFQSDGNFVVYDGSGSVVWASGVHSPGARLLLQGDGNLVTYDVGGRPVWDSRTGGIGSARLLMQDDGNLVLYRGAGSAAWASLRGALDRLRSPQQLASGQALVSRNGQYRVTMQGDGNVVVYAPDGRVPWASGTAAPGARVVMQPDGNLVAYAADRAVWHTATGGIPGAWLLMQDDGNLVVYRADGSAAWATGGDTPDRLRAPQQLFPGQALRSPNGRYRVVSQPDGNLVVYSAGGRVVWANARQGSGARLTMQGDGNLVSYAGDGRAIWATGTGRFAGAVAQLQDDGSLTVRQAGRVVWASPPDGIR